MKILFPIVVNYPCQFGVQTRKLHWHVSALGNEHIKCTKFTHMCGIELTRVLSNQIAPIDCGNVYYAGNVISLRCLQFLNTQIKKEGNFLLSCILNIISTIVVYKRTIFFSRKYLIYRAYDELSPDTLRFSHMNNQPSLFFNRIIYNMRLFYPNSDKKSQDIRGFFNGISIPNISNLKCLGETIQVKKGVGFYLLVEYMK